MWIVLALVAALAYLVGDTLNVAGSFKSLSPHAEVVIKKVYAGMAGPEDMDIDRDTGLLFISSADRWKNMRGEKTNDGIYLLSIQSEADPRKLSTTYAGEFHPHGISFLKTDSASWLFVVNHNSKGSEILLFEYRSDSLFHKGSFSSQDLCCPNDVVGIDANERFAKFYVTNDHGTTGGLMRTLEDYLRLPLSSLLYYDGNSFSKAHGGFNYANGINVSKDGTKLYVATTTGRNLITFNRDLETGKLELVSTTPLKTGADNIDVDENGDLWVGAHPKLFAFVAHAKDSSKHSPSQVLKLTPEPGGNYTVREVYLDEGSQLSGSSIAVRYGNELFIGVVFESKVIRAELK